MNIVVSLKTHEIIAVSAIAHYDDTVSPYPDPAPDEKGLVRSFSLDLDAEERTGDDPATKVIFKMVAQNI